jgi:hypothetical protein
MITSHYALPLDLLYTPPQQISDKHIQNITNQTFLQLTLPFSQQRLVERPWVDHLFEGGLKLPHVWVIVLSLTQDAASVALKLVLVARAAFPLFLGHYLFR